MNLRFNQLMHDNVVEASFAAGKISFEERRATAAAQSLNVLASGWGNRQLLANSSVKKREARAWA
jgi:hypothetical protein